MESKGKRMAETRGSLDTERRKVLELRHQFDSPSLERGHGVEQKGGKEGLSCWCETKDSGCLLLFMSRSQESWVSTACLPQVT